MDLFLRIFFYFAVKLLWQGAACWRETLKLLHIAEEAEHYEALNGEEEEELFHSSIVKRRFASSSHYFFFLNMKQLLKLSKKLVASGF